MLRIPRGTVRPLLICAVLTACALPPPDQVVGAKTTQERLALGTNRANEVCTLQRGEARSEVYCGTYEEPAGRIITPHQAMDPTSFVTSSPWREAFDRRFVCGPVGHTTVQGAPAATLSCTWREGGYPQVVLATQLNGTLYVADGVGPAEAVLPQAIGVLSGRLPAKPVAASDQSGLATRQLAEQSVNLEGAGAIEAVNRLTESGAFENRRGNFAAAEAAYKQSVELQEKILKNPNSPALAVPLAREALQVSNQGRFSEADKLFARAQRLVASPQQHDPVAQPMVWHLRALDLLNRRRNDRAQEALALLDKAEAAFAAVVPPDALRPRPRASTGGRGGVEQMAQIAADTALLADQSSANALNGLIETRRYKAIALKYLGRAKEADAQLAAARDLYIGRDPRLAARYYRSVGMIAEAAGRSRQAVSDLGDAVDIFARAQNGSRPLAETQLLLADQYARDDEYRAALRVCREAIDILQSLKAGADGRLIVPCLHALSDHGGSGAQMFAAEQLAQGSITSQQIARATARMAAGARDPKAAKAIRDRDTAIARLDELYRRKADIAADKDKTAEVAAIDKQIAQAQDARQAAGQALQAASPGFAQLVQESVTASETQALLGPHEALAAIVLGNKEGWTVLLRHDRILTGRIDAGIPKIDALVKRFRSGMELHGDGQPPPFDSAAALELYKLVLGPVADGLQDVTALTVAPSGSLLSVPFGALLTGPVPLDGFQHAPFLIQKMAISHVPSAASFVNLRKAVRTLQANQQPWYGMGDPVPPSEQQARQTYPVDACGESASLLSGFQPLPGSLQELTAARQILGGSANDQMLRGQFTAQNVLNAQLGNFRILHFATHAVLPGELRCQSEPAIVTSTSPTAHDASQAMLTASEIEEKLHLNAELVILAACNTGGPNGGEAGESLSGLARSFLFAGARSLLVTHWEANDRTTTYLTALFLGALQRNPQAGPAEALAEAQRTMLSQATGQLAILGHPYYWAVEALIGGEGARSGAKVAAVAQSSHGG